MYGVGAAIHFDPRTVDSMTLWELFACLDGYIEAHGGQPPLEPPTDEDFEQRIAVSKAWKARRERAKLEAAAKKEAATDADPTPSD